ncbi:MAG: serine/threonine protein kinase/Flp pilus assembly protein TadD [Planctomycetota bacterium]|jgi:serine/threonine protein kinase/Flp pilus assembly protein TadD
MLFAHFEFNPETDRLGEGPLSEVYRAVDQRLGRTVALKILRAHAEIDPAADTRFHREAKHASNLQHESIATVYEYGQAQNTSFIAMEYLEGRTLDAIIKDQTLGFEECRRIALELTSALAHVHKNGLIHRDLKPGNIMVLDDGKVKLLDFGIARASNESSITQHGTLVGTVLYMSPEQVRGDDLEYRSDIFSLGAVIYHMLTGTLPFPGKSFPEVCMAILDGKPRRPSEVRSGLSPAFEEFLLRCLAAKATDRFADADKAYGALLSIGDRRAVNRSAASKIEGTLLVMPVICNSDATTTCKNIAGSIRNDLAGELGRIQGLSVELAPGDNVPSGAVYNFVLRSTFKLSPPNATLNLRLEPYSANGTGLNGFDEVIEQEDEDEWTLQADLVRAATRTIRRRLEEMSITPMIDATRNVERALKLTQHAHNVLLKGTSKHLMAAISSFRAAQDADPYCALAYAGLAEALARKYMYWDGDESFLVESREKAERALALNKNCAEAHTSLGFSYHISGRLTDADREYRIAIQLDNQEWRAHRLLGSVMAREGNFKSAAGYLRKAIALKPTHIPSYDQYYSVLQRLDRYEDSLQVADEGISAARAHLKVHKDDQEARLNLALLLARLASHDEARKHAELAIKTAPKDGFTSFFAACVYCVTGDFTDAIEQLTRARDRGFYTQVELRDNRDLDVLRGLPEFQSLQN